MLPCCNCCYCVTSLCAKCRMLNGGNMEAGLDFKGGKKFTFTYDTSCKRFLSFMLNYHALIYCFHSQGDKILSNAVLNEKNAINS